MRIAKCLYLADPFYTCQRKNVLHAQISLHETVQILLQIAMLFAVQKLPGLVTCKRGIINIETEIWA